MISDLKFKMNPNVFTSCYPDPIGQMLGTGMNRFESRHGICGLAKETEAGKTIEILAVESVFAGAGNFRRFIHTCQENYSAICVWHICNPILEKALLRYGFTPETDIAPDGEVMRGLRWDRPTGK